MYTFITFCENAAVVRNYDNVRQVLSAVKDCAPFMRVVVVKDEHVIFEKDHKSMSGEKIYSYLEEEKPIRPLYAKEINSIKLTYKVNQI